MNDDQLYYFLVDKSTRNVLQVEYPSDIDEFNKILGTSEGKGSLLKDLGIVLTAETKVFTNPVPIKVETTQPATKEVVPVQKIEVKPKRVKTEKLKSKEIAQAASINLFDGLFD